MANVGFKLGSQSALDVLLAKGAGANAVEGSFYLTSDTNRLYIGKADGSLAPVNQGVLTVDKVTAGASDAEGTTYLPSAATASQTGSFYYVKEGNILCVASGGKWVQINAVKTIQKVAHEYTATDENTVNVATKVAVGVDAATADSKEASMTVAGAGSVHVSPILGDAGLTITGDTYEISAEEGAAEGTVVVNLTSSTETDSSSFSLIAGDNVSLSVDESGNIIIASEFINSDTDTVLSALAFTDNGAESSGAKTGFNLTATKQIKDVLTNTVTATTTVEAELDPAIQIGVKEGSKKTVKFTDGVAALDVYTKEELDGTLQALNAMTYRGTVGTGGSAGTAVTVAENGGINGILNGEEALTFAVGDTFLVVEDLKVNNKVVVTKGSLLIAKGTEEDGVITSGLTFDSVANSSDTDTTYAFDSDDDINGILLKQNAGGTVTYPSSFAVVGGEVEDGASVSVTKSGSEGNIVLTVTHDTVAAPTETAGTDVSYTPTAENGTEFKAIVGVTTDATGHLTGYQTASLELPNMSVAADMDVAVATADDGTSTATITPSATITTKSSEATLISDAVTGTAVNVKSSSLTLTKPADGTVQVEMVWGSFE